MTLAAFQALFQQRILAGPGADDAPLLAALNPSQHGADARTLLGVYQHGYRLRLAGFLAEDHPVLRHLMGADAFEALVDAYIDAHPPRAPNARCYTTALPEFMQATAPWRDDPLSISLAMFERAMVDAFDAADAPPLTLEALAEFAPEAWSRLVFGLHPSLSLLELAPGALKAYAAATQGDATRDNARDADRRVENVAVWRIGHDSAFRALAADEFVALNEAKAGRAFGDICQMTAFQQSGEITPERLAQCLASWFNEGMIVSVRLQETDQLSNTPSSA